MNTSTAAAPPQPPPPLSAPRTALRVALIMAAFTVVFTALMAFAHQVSRPYILASMQEAQMRLIDEVLPRGSYDNKLLDDAITVTGAPLRRAWRARKQAAPVALVLETAAPDGYGGRIELIITLDADGMVGGVRVTAHQETPGLGDYIDPKKDKDKKRPWISQFTGLDPGRLAPGMWQVAKDGGLFRYRTGATVSARAVTRATGAALVWAAAHRDALFDAPAGSAFSAEEKP
jgi:electron transport complex protein RnfG